MRKDVYDDLVGRERFLMVGGGNETNSEGMEAKLSFCLLRTENNQIFFSLFYVNEVANSEDLSFFT